MSGDRGALVTVRHGRDGSPVFPRSDTDEGRSVRAGRGSAEDDIRVRTVRHPYFGRRAAQRPASGAPLATSIEWYSLWHKRDF